MSAFISPSAIESTSSKKRKNPEKGYRLNCQQIFLTYPQCDLELELVKDKLIEIVKEFNNSSNSIDKYIIAREKHVDGNNHLHVYLLLEKKINIRNERAFDIDKHHPNVQGVRSWKNVIKYVTKEGNYISNYENKVLLDIIENEMKMKDVYTKARKIAKTGDVKKALEVLEHPKTARDLTLHGNAIERNLRTLVPKVNTNKYSINQFIVDFEWDRSKSLVLWGPTNTGKTSLAKALLPNGLFVRHKDQLKKYATGEYEGIIFDDMCFDKWEREWIIAIVDIDDDTALDVKHGYVEIPAGTPRIFTSNRSPENQLLANDDAIKRRLQTVNIKSSVKRQEQIVPSVGVISPTTTTTTTTEDRQIADNPTNYSWYNTVRNRTRDEFLAELDDIFPELNTEK